VVQGSENGGSPHYEAAMLCMCELQHFKSEIIWSIFKEIWV
jgi:hypothetical protein